MHRVNINYSLKNIGLPTHHHYQRELINKAESVIQRMRWKAHFFLHGNENTNCNKFGLPTRNSAPYIPEMKAFEEDFINLISNVKFRKINDKFLNNIAKDMKHVESSENVLIFADKSRNIYETTPDIYNKLLTDNITSTYKSGENHFMNDINSDLKDISCNLGIGDRIDIMAKTPAFITLKDHKDNFDFNPKCRLINPAKSELGKVSKIILDEINNNLRSRLHLNQWKNTASVINWFNSINNKPNHTFLSFDIVEFYPSITESLLDKVIAWARSLTEIPDDHINIIKHARKSLLFYNDKVWVKKNNQSLFDVTMGSYDGAEVCELVGLFLLSRLAIRFGKDNVGLYRDDGLLILEGTGGRMADQARKKLHEIFNEQDLKITADINHHIVNFLDVTLNLTEEYYQPYRKPNNEPLYVDARSNHPPNIIKEIPKSINKRLSSLSSNEKSFKENLPVYQEALKRSKHKVTLSYSDQHSSSQHRCNSQRKRNIIWFNPPFSKNVKTNVAHRFLQLVDKHFPKSSKLHKIFNRNSVKVSYSCMPNVKSVISNHNRRIMKSNKTSMDQMNCNCRVKDECPLRGECLTESLVYKAEIATTDTHESKIYIGVTAGTFKSRFNNHKKSLNNPAYENETELSKYAWNLKRLNKSFNIRWSIIKCVPAYSAGGRSCNLCLEEKMSILKSEKNNTLNKRTELFSKCRHKRKFSARNFKRASIPCNSNLNCKRKRQSHVITPELTEKPM